MPHQHNWEIDYSAPVRDMHPPIYYATCKCGATADLQSGIARNIVEPNA